MIKRFVLFILGLRECFYCSHIVGDWELQDNTYPHADSTSYLHICMTCSRRKHGLPEPHEREVKGSSE